MEFLSVFDQDSVFGVALGIEKFGGPFDPSPLFTHKVNLPLPTRPEGAEDFILGGQDSSRFEIESVEWNRFCRIQFTPPSDGALKELRVRLDGVGEKYANPSPEARKKMGNSNPALLQRKNQGEPERV